MIGYKATYDGKSKNITYDIDKIYTFNGKISLGKQGFHFYGDMEDVFAYYPPFFENKKLKVYEIKILGDIIKIDCDAVTDKFYIIKEADISNWIKYDKKRKYCLFYK